MNPQWQQLFASLTPEESRVFDALCVNDVYEQGPFPLRILKSLEAKGLAFPDTEFEVEGATPATGAYGWGVPLLVHYHWTSQAILEVPEP